MGKAESIIANTIKESGMTIRAVSKKTEIPYGQLQPSMKGHRDLRADEFLRLCALLNLDPRVCAEIPPAEQGGA